MVQGDRSDVKLGCAKCCKSVKSACLTRYMRVLAIRGITNAAQVLDSAPVWLRAPLLWH